MILLPGFGILTYAQMFMHAIAHGSCTDSYHYCTDLIVEVTPNTLPNTSRNALSDVVASLFENANKTAKLLTLR